MDNWLRIRKRLLLFPLLVPLLLPLVFLLLLCIAIAIFLAGKFENQWCDRLRDVELGASGRP